MTQIWFQEQIFGNGVGKTNGRKTSGKEVTLQDLRIIIRDGDYLVIESMKQNEKKWITFKKYF